jgi:hypothetical protein
VRSIRFGVLALLFVCSCYSPRLRNRGYACDQRDPKPCPDGYACVDGICDNGAGGPGPIARSQDLSIAASGDDMAESTADLAQTVGDMAKPIAIPDLAQPLVDLAQSPPDLAPSCVALDGYCPHDDSVCCSKWCNYNTNKCIPHP